MLRRPTQPRLDRSFPSLNGRNSYFPSLKAPVICLMRTRRFETGASDVLNYHMYPRAHSSISADQVWQDIQKGVSSSTQPGDREALYIAVACGEKEGDLCVRCVSVLPILPRFWQCSHPIFIGTGGMPSHCYASCRCLTLCTHMFVGTFRWGRCGTDLFQSDTKFDSGTGNGCCGITFQNLLWLCKPFYVLWMHQSSCL